MHNLQLQTVLDAIVSKARQERMADSDQLSLGELILKLEAIADKSKKVYYDFGGCVPATVGSWRGVYAELALDYSLAEPKTVENILAILKEANGKTFQGYKGGDFKMGRQTPIWVANCGESGVTGYKEEADGYPSVGVIDVLDGDMVILVTAICES